LPHIGEAEAPHHYGDESTLDLPSDQDELLQALLELKDFSRISLAPGETKTVVFRVDASKPAMWTKAMRYEVEPGMFEVMVGASLVEWKKVELRVE